LALEEVQKEVSELPRNAYRFKLWFAAVLAASFLGVGWLVYSNVSRSPIEDGEGKMNSGNLSVDYSIQQALSDGDRLALNAMNVPVIVRVEDLSSSAMSLDPDSMDRARTMIRELKQREYNVIVEPYPWIGDGEYYETDWNPDNVDEFFRNWSGILRELLDQVAIPEKADALVVASNLAHLENHSERWSKIIGDVKDRFDGRVTYKTNWWYTAEWDPASKAAFEEKMNNSLFGEVDFISIAAYFELSDRQVNSAEQLADSLLSSNVHDRRQNIAEEIERLHKRWNKPIFFGELGFPKREYAARNPWNPDPSGTYNGTEQANGFEAYRRTFTQDWFMGFSVFAIGEDGDDKRYYPSEESAQVIRSWFE
jgi:hypothetical protein